MAALTEYEKAEKLINPLFVKFQKNIFEIDKLGDQPYKPSPDKRFFGKRGRSGADAADRKFYDESKKKYEAWYRRKLKLEKENGALSNQI